MMNRILSILTLVGAAGAMGTLWYSSQPGANPSAPESLEASASASRWYDQQQEVRGGPLFQAHCASCHMADASGTPNWKDPTADGNYPPPPLNGTAHAWHHPLSVLRRTVQRGGVALGGTMPGFADKLNAQEISDILAWVQSHWSDRIYAVWEQRDAQSRASVRR